MMLFECSELTTNLTCPSSLSCEVQVSTVEVVLTNCVESFKKQLEY
jgi:hypothetical protein